MQAGPAVGLGGYAVGQPQDDTRVHYRQQSRPSLEVVWCASLYFQVIMGSHLFYAVSLSLSLSLSLSVVFILSVLLA